MKCRAHLWFYRRSSVSHIGYSCTSHSVNLSGLYSATRLFIFICLSFTSFEDQKYILYAIIPTINCLLSFIIFITIFFYKLCSDEALRHQLKREVLRVLLFASSHFKANSNSLVRTEKTFFGVSIYSVRSSYERNDNDIEENGIDGVAQEVCAGRIWVSDKQEPGTSREWNWARVTGSKSCSGRT